MENKIKDHLTEEDINKKIKDKKFTILEDGKTTICNLYLENGYTVRGEAACVNPANFKKDLGEKLLLKMQGIKFGFLKVIYFRKNFLGQVSYAL